MIRNLPQGHVAIACGGTGGHLFPGIAVGLELRARGTDVTLLISPKEVDQAGVRAVRDQFRISTLPVIGLTRGNLVPFVRGLLEARRTVRRLFESAPPHAVLAMGGFTSAVPVLAGRRLRAATLLHESNTIPGRANRWLAPWVDECLVGFAEAAGRLRRCRVVTTGTPVRPGFFSASQREARERLGIDPQEPVLLVMGGSQGASGINRRLVAAYAGILQKVPSCRWIHLTGVRDFQAMETAAKSWPGLNRILPFSEEMEVLMAAATAAVSRAGASSLAELAAVRLPSLLIPYPSATDDHQAHNARVFSGNGAAVALSEVAATPERLVELLVPLLLSTDRRRSMQTALGCWAAPEAAARIADRVIEAMRRRHPKGGFVLGPTEWLSGGTARSAQASREVYP